MAISMSGTDLVPEGALYRFLAIPCSRHDVGENDPRVRLILGCVLAHICNMQDEDTIRECTDFLIKTLRLHDHKGSLFVVSKAPIPDELLSIFEDYWRMLDIWGGFGIEPCPPDSELWDEIWGMKRFKSDWTPDAPH